MKFQDLNTEFSKQFGNQNPIHVKAPGRFNILGEHIDYSGGTVLPAAVEQSIDYLVSQREDQEIVLWAIDFNEIWEGKINGYDKTEIQWVNYFLGVLSELKSKINTGFNLVFTGNIPKGGGMSSSAALEVGFVMALNEIFKLGLNRLEMAQICQKAEQNYGGVNCGIMDMYASLFGEKDKVIVLDCHNLKSDLIELDTQDFSFILINSGVSHSLANSAYNQRRATCQKAFDLLKINFPDLEALSLASQAEYEAIKQQLTEDEQQKIEYVIEENERVKLAIKAIENKNLFKLGELMIATHWGLSKKYEVSCMELDFIVETVLSLNQVIGARLMGGGFGGCVLTLLKTDQIENVSKAIQEKYEEKIGIVPAIYKIKPEQGASIL